MLKKMLVGLLMLLVLVGLASAAEVQYIDASDDEVTILWNDSGNFWAKGIMYESGVRLYDQYWNFTQTATPSSGDTTHISTAGQIFAYIAGLDQIWSGNNTEEIQDAAWSGIGTETLIDVTYQDASDNVDFVVTDMRNASSDHDWFFVNNDELAGNMSNSSSYWRANNDTVTTAIAGAGGISNVVEDTTPQLGGNLDVNGYNVTYSGEDIGFTINSSGIYYWI